MKKYNLIFIFKPLHTIRARTKIFQNHMTFCRPCPVRSLRRLKVTFFFFFLLLSSSFFLLLVYFDNLCTSRLCNSKSRHSPEMGLNCQTRTDAQSGIFDLLFLAKKRPFLAKRLRKILDFCQKCPALDLESSTSSQRRMLVMADP